MAIAGPVLKIEAAACPNNDVVPRVPIGDQDGGAAASAAGGGVTVAGGQVALAGQATPAVMANGAGNQVAGAGKANVAGGQAGDAGKAAQAGMANVDQPLSPSGVPPWNMQSC